MKPPVALNIALIANREPLIQFVRDIALPATTHQLRWYAGCIEEAYTNLRSDSPDLVILEIDEQLGNSVEITQTLVKRYQVGVLLVSYSNQYNTSIAFNALGAGALDIVALCQPDANNKNTASNALIQKLAQLAKILLCGEDKSNSNDKRARSSRGSETTLVAIGSSTGGPTALATIVAALPTDFPAAIVIVQHLDPAYAGAFAEWLQDQSPLPVRLIKSGEYPEPGQILVACTSDHLALKSNGSLAYVCEPVNYPYRPSVDVFFESAAAYWPGAIIGVLLTGMGRDGAQGLLTLRNRGMLTIAQSENTCAIYGMPKAAIELHAAGKIVDLQSISNEILKNIQYEASDKAELPYKSKNKQRNAL